MSGININIGADTRSFQAGVSDVADQLQKVTQELDATTEAGDQTGASIQAAMEKAQRASSEAASGVQNIHRDWADVSEVIGLSGQAAEKTGEKYTEAGKAGEKMAEGGKLGEAAMMNLGFSAMSASTLFTSGLQGMAEQVGTFAAFMGPSMAGVEGAVGGLAWPITIAGVAVAALAGLMGQANQESSTLAGQTKDLISGFIGAAAGADQLDEGIRKWSKDATDFGGVALNDMQKAAEAAGVGWGDLASSIATQSLPAMREQQKAIQDQIRLLTQQETVAAGGRNQGLVAQDKAKIDSLNTLNKSLETNIKANQAAAEAERLVAEQMGLTVQQYSGYNGALADAAAKNVDLSTAQKETIQLLIASGVSADGIKKQIDDYAAALAQAKSDQDSWTSSVEGSFSSAANASKDWATKNTVDLGTVTKNLSEAADLAENLPARINAALGAGLTQAGLKMLESFPNGEEIISQVGINPGSAASQKLIAQANRLGDDTAKGFDDGLTKPVTPPFTVKGVDTSEADAKLASWMARKRSAAPITVDVAINDSALQRLIKNPPKVLVPGQVVMQGLKLTG